MNGYGPNVVIPEPYEAERDEHEHNPCTYANPCAACQRSWKR